MDVILLWKTRELLYRRERVPFISIIFTITWKKTKWYYKVCGTVNKVVNTVNTLTFVAASLSATRTRSYRNTATTEQRFVRYHLSLPLTKRTLTLMLNKNRWYDHRYITNQTRTTRHKRIREKGAAVVVVVVVVCTKRSLESKVYHTTMI